MRFRTTIFCLIISGLFATNAMSQAGGGALTPEQRIEKRLAHQQKKLGLTDDQVAKLKSILEQNMSRLKADRLAMRAAAPGPDKQAARKTMQSDMKSLREQLKQILTPEQLKKWKQEQIEQIDRRQERLERRRRALEK